MNSKVFRTFHLILIASALLVLRFPAAGADLRLPVLRSGTVVYSNVTVYSLTKEDLYISHAQGLGNIKISTLDEESLVALGLHGAQSESGKTLKGKANALFSGVKAQLAKLPVNLPVAAREPGKFLPQTLPHHVLAAIAAGILAIYLFSCYCLALICRNAGTKTGVVIYLPVVQMLPLLAAARMPAWKLVLYLIPLVNLFAHLTWCLRIAKACGKSNLIGTLLFIPGPSVLALLYLAFSKGKAAEETAEPQIMKFDGLIGG